MLKPYEFLYINHPFSATAEELLKFTLLDLCLRDSLHISNHWVYVGRREPRPMLRSFINKGPAFDTETYTAPERFFTDIFNTSEELPFNVLRNHVLDNFESYPGSFKNKYVYNAIRAKGLCILRYFISAAARQLRDETNSKIKHIEQLVEQENDEEQIKILLLQLGSLFLFLEDKTLEKLKTLNKRYQLIKNYDMVVDFPYSFTPCETFSSDGSGTGGSWGGGSFGGGYGFSGFGGGGFGGGGASGGW